MGGVSQGSVIGPLLSVLFINDMPEGVKFNVCKLFADDCKLFGSANTDNDNKMQASGDYHFMHLNAKL